MKKQYQNFLLKFEILFIFAIFANSLIAQNAHAIQDNNNIDLLWSCNTYTPNNYNGKALPIRGSSITVVAMPFGENRNSLSYKWYLDNDYIVSSSGINMSNFTFTATKWAGYKHNVLVEVTNSAQNKTNYGIISIEIHSPEIVFPEIQNNNITVNRRDNLILTAMPYFFTTQNIQYNWIYDSEELSRFKNQNTININIPSQSYYQSESKLQIIAQNISNPLEQVIKTITIEIQ